MTTNQIDKSQLTSHGTGKGAKYLAYTVQDAHDYDWKVKALVPCYGKMLKTIVNYVRDFGSGTKILDLGSGTGTLAKMLLESRSDFRLRLVDFSEAMCHVAAKKLRTFASRVNIECRDMCDLQTWDSQIVLSTLALHECHGDLRTSLLCDVLSELPPRAVLIIGDYYRSSMREQAILATEIRKHARAFDIADSEVDEEISEHLLDEDIPSLDDAFQLVNAITDDSPHVIFEGHGIFVWAIKRPLGDAHDTRRKGVI